VADVFVNRLAKRMSMRNEIHTWRRPFPIEGRGRWMADCIARPA